MTAGGEVRDSIGSSRLDRLRSAGIDLPRYPSASGSTSLVVVVISRMAVPGEPTESPPQPRTSPTSRKDVEPQA